MSAATTTSAWGAYGLTVRYGDTLAVDDVTLRVPTGEVTAVVGGDGAGKTTLLRALVGGAPMASGRIAAPPRPECGFMPTGASGVWVDLTVDENVAFVGAAYGLRGAALARRRDELLDGAGLTAAHGRVAGRLSGGMRQKLAFCLAMLHAPRLLVLDEPSTGVDPVSRVDLWRLVARAAVDGAAVAMATTYLDEAERASSVLVLDGGRVLAAGTPEAIRAGAPGTITTRTGTTGDAPGPDPSRSWRRGHATRTWHPGPPAPGEHPIDPDMEDAVVAATLSANLSANPVSDAAATGPAT